MHASFAIVAIQQILDLTAGFHGVAKHDGSAASGLSEGLEELLSLDVEADFSIAIEPGRHGNIHEPLVDRGSDAVQARSANFLNSREFRLHGLHDLVGQRRRDEDELRLADIGTGADGAELLPERLVHQQDVHFVQNDGLQLAEVQSRIARAQDCGDPPRRRDDEIHRSALDDAYLIPNGRRVLSRRRHDHGSERHDVRYLVADDPNLVRQFGRWCQHEGLGSSVHAVLGRLCLEDLLENWDEVRQRLAAASLVGNDGVIPIQDLRPSQRLNPRWSVDSGTVANHLEQFLRAFDRERWIIQCFLAEEVGIRRGDLCWNGVFLLPRLFMITILTIPRFVTRIAIVPSSSGLLRTIPSSVIVSLASPGR
mmetsp:Transcript_6562/g.19274  ORF Transcript_6562/g.19274 Transcript_6562/m.19274 type:complete len:367 (-) Transcript_6562:28-1128(-)